MSGLSAALAASTASSGAAPAMLPLGGAAATAHMRSKRWCFALCVFFFVYVCAIVNGVSAGCCTCVGGAASTAHM